MAKAILKGPLVLWHCSFASREKNLPELLKENKYFPFQVQQPKVFVIEYYKDMIWKGLVIFLLSLGLSILHFKAPRQGTQDFTIFFVFGMLTGLWLSISNIHKRRLIINHIKEVYQFYIKGILWQEGPLHQIYVRLIAQTDAYGKRYYSLIINGYRLEVLTLAALTDQFELLDSVGRRIARNLNLNFFDYEDVSTRHVIRHLPPERYDDDDDMDYGENTSV
ncbi:cation channel sperm-associated auxiliary subunit TMEM249 [Podarcis muralis]